MHGDGEREVEWLLGADGKPDVVGVDNGRTLCSVLFGRGLCLLGERDRWLGGRTLGDTNGTCRLGP